MRFKCKILDQDGRCFLGGWRCQLVLRGKIIQKASSDCIEAGFLGVMIGLGGSTGSWPGIPHRSNSDLKELEAE